VPTRETETNAGLGPAAKRVAERARSLVRLELELAALELKRKLVALGLGIGLGAGALFLLVFALGFGFATVAAALATAVSTWLALLITTGILLGLAAVLGIFALRSIRKGTPPVPEQAIAEAKRTSAALKSDGRA
jgi:membrane protein